MSTKTIKFLIILIFCYNIHVITSNDGFCDVNDETKCTTTNNKSNRYILYDINPPEGFNLRRDVYMRLAIFVNSLKKSKNSKLNNFKLVLPPWSQLYHWRSDEDNSYIPWSHFFDLKSLQNFAPVTEMYQFFNEIGTNYKQTLIDEVYILQNFEDMFTTGNFEDRFAVEPCAQKQNINFYEYGNLTSKNIKCLSFHGLASQLSKILVKSDSRTYLFHHAEIVLHDRYGDKIYWQARRSMRFNTELRKLANKFREKYLNSTDLEDNTIIPNNWRDEKPHRTAKGGPYLCVHLRRQDFLRGRPSDVPSLENAAQQIKIILKKNNLTKVFVATDAPIQEFNELKKIISTKYELYKFNPSKEILSKYKDGGIAIIEQIICSHAFYFIGTHESTYSFRIQEEREILGFPTKKTFNRLCGNNNKKCDKPSMWKIVY